MSEFENFVEAVKRGDLNEVTSAADAHPEFINRKDQEGATALHYAAFGGHRPVVQFLVGHGAEINARDTQFHATPAGWAIEYLRELGGFLGIELDDVAFAIGHGDVEWVARFLKRFPAVRAAADAEGTPLSRLAEESETPEIARLFAAEEGRS